MLSSLLKTFARPATLRCFSSSSITNMPVKAGDKFPSVDLYENSPEGKVNLAKEYAKGKIVIFGVPGAFTPTCNKEHLPGFLSNAGELKKRGVNEIVCVAVNDPFVMAAWGQAVGVENKVRMLADTCGELTKALDLELDATAILGNKRCKRFSMVVQDGVVKSVNVEPDGVGATCSMAPNILSQV